MEPEFTAATPETENDSLPTKTAEAKPAEVVFASGEERIECATTAEPVQSVQPSATDELASTDAAAATETQDGKKHNPAGFKLHDLLIIGVTFVVILVLGIYFKQSPVRLIPCLVTLAVLMLCAHASRWGYLLGALNSVLYAIGYFQLRVYGQVASALIVSFPIQLFTFIHWSRQRIGKQVTVKALGAKKRAVTVVVTSVAWGVAWAVLHVLKDFNAPLSAATFVIGLLSSVLAMFAYYENCFVNLLSYTITLILNVLLVIDSMGNITYLIIGLYGLYQSISGCFIWTRLYKIQHVATCGEDK